MSKLHDAIRANDLDLVKQLVEAGEDVNDQDDNGFTVLNLAAYYGYLDIVIYLVEQGADIEAKNEDEYTALLLATLNGGRTEIVKYLVENGADVNVKNMLGHTALYIASFWNYTDVVEYLKGLSS